MLQAAPNKDSFFTCSSLQAYKDTNNTFKDKIHNTFSILYIGREESENTYFFPNLKFGSIYPLHCYITTLNDHNIKPEILSFI